MVNIPNFQLKNGLLGRLGSVYSDTCNFQGACNSSTSNAKRLKTCKTKRQTLNSVFTCYGQKVLFYSNT